MRIVLLVLALVAAIYAQSCPLSTPVRCPNSQCVASASECPSNTCSGLQPYLCSDGNCASDSLHCNCIGVLCVDGSCKTAITECPILSACPPERPQRCPNGQCFAYNYNCINSPPPTCDPGLVVCIDGLCRTTVQCASLPYNGCPSYQCPDGTCTTDFSTCLCSQTLQRCWDGSCVAVGTVCAVQPPASSNPMNTTTTVARTSSSTTTIPTSTNSSTTLARVTIPVNTTNNATDSLNAKAVPTSTLLTTVTKDPAGNTLTPTLISAPISLTMGSGQSTFNNSLLISITSQMSNVTAANPCCATLVGVIWVCMNSSSNITQVNGTLSSNCTTNHFSVFAIIDAPQYICTPSCPEDTCLEEKYDLVLGDGTIVGWVDVGNKLAHEIHFELHTFEDRNDENFGWQLVAIKADVGAVHYADRFTERYREFVKIDMEDAFPPRGKVKCWENVAWKLAATIFADGPCSEDEKKRNNNCDRVYETAYVVPSSAAPVKRNKAPYPNFGTANYTHNMCCECDYRAEKQADWGRECSGNSLGCYLDTAYPACYPNNIFKIGCDAGNTITFDSSTKLQAYMDRATQPAAKLTSSHFNPASTESGKFGGLVAALSLDDRLDRCDKDFAGTCDWLKNLHVCPPETSSDAYCSMFFGQTIGDVLASANDYLGGCANPAPGVTLDKVSKCLDFIMISLSGGRRPIEFAHRGFLKTPC